MKTTSVLLTLALTTTWGSLSRGAESAAPAAPATPATPALPAASAPDNDSAAGLWKQIITVYFIHPATREEAAKQEKMSTAERYQKARDLCQELIRRFPASPERWDAELESIDLRKVAGQMKLDAFSLAEAGEAYTKLLGNPALPDEKRKNVLVRKLMQDLYQGRDNPDAIPKFTAALAEGMDRYGVLPFQGLLRASATMPGYVPAFLASGNAKLREAAENYRYTAEFAQLRKDAKTDPEKALGRLKELAKLPTPEVAKTAQSLVNEIEMAAKVKSTPLELAFTAVDGHEIDLSKMRGKVVLVDFWATWCGPCMAEVPHVVEVYQKQHDAGFEIVGISLDKEGDLDKLKQVTKAKGMVWPQHFDGKGWDGTYPQQFGIRAIPAMWLVNKKGLVVDMDAREGLEEKVAKLLAE